MKANSILTISFLSVCLISSAQIIHVPSDQPSIQAGIDAASTGDTVLVDEGVYNEQINFKGKAITVASNFLITGDNTSVDSTIIDGYSPVPVNNGAVVYFISGEDTTSILIGFTISNGTGHYPDAWNDRSGGGIYMSESTAKILHNKILNNTIDTWTGAYGGGIAVNTLDNKWVVIKGNAIMNNSVQSSQEKSEGGGIYTLCNAIIEDNTINGNSCGSTATPASSSKCFGGGLSLGNYTGMPLYVYLTNNTICDNTVSGLPRGGGLSLYSMDGYIGYNLVDGNTLNCTWTERAWGCGVYMDGTYLGSGLAFEHNEITNNSSTASLAVGGGIGMYDMDLSFSINANIIENNSAHFGGGICSKLTNRVEITNNIIAKNTAGIRGGGLFFTSDVFDHLETRQDDRCMQVNIVIPPDSKAWFPLVINNSITANEAQVYGGGLASRQTNFPILSFNNIFLDNSAQMSGNEVHIDEDCDFYIYYSNIDTNEISGPWAGNNNIPGDPLFCDDSCHIDVLAGSPCYNTGAEKVQISGTGTWYYAPQYDIDGDLRPIDAYYDIGATEDDSNTCNPTVIEEQVLKRTSYDLQNIPNPFNQQTRILYKISEPGHVIIRIFSSKGQLVYTLLESEQFPGSYEIPFYTGNFPAGIYFCQILTSAGRETIKMIILNK